MNKSSLKISIIIPSYNRAHKITKTIDSVVSQSYENWELIIVDDGSTDNTKEVVSSFKDERIKYIYQDNAERGAARNKGVKNATGKYVFFLDSDDILYPRHLQHAKDNLVHLNYPEFFHIRYEEDYGTKKQQAPELYNRTVLKKTLIQNQFACQFFLRKEIADQFPFSENRSLKIGEDWLLVLKIASRYQLHFSNEVHAAIIHHGERTMQLASAEEILLSMNLMIEDLSKVQSINESIIKNVKADLTTLAALSYALEGKRKLALQNLRKGIGCRFRQLFRRRTLAIFKHILYGKR
jgi:glycosyltransferase involved in cell wall biosynthesis